MGARPQFIKHAYLSKKLSDKYNVYLINTGQHYDDTLSGMFFRDMNIPTPDINLNIGSGTHGEQTGKMIIGIEKQLMDVKPDYVLVYGDTNSTLAGAIAASKLNIPIIHIEAGLRSYDNTMPEEINRIIVDRISDMLYAPTVTARGNLIREGIDIHKIRMLDVVEESLKCNIEKTHNSDILNLLNLQQKSYFVSTIHRKSNVDNNFSLVSLIKAMSSIQYKIILPIHPGTKQKMIDYGIYDYLKQSENIMVVDPVGYVDMLTLVYNSAGVITDSGGLQHEADLLNIPCITLRDTTEWIESIMNKNILVGNDYNKIVKAANDIIPKRCIQ